MPLPAKYIGVHGDECQCGRRASVRHCISCGSVRIYARMERMHTLASGEKRFVDVQFRCMSCGHLFIEIEREFCEAPPVSAALARQRIKAIHDASQTGEYLNPSDVKIADAIQALMPASQEDPKLAYDKLIYHLRVEYADRKAGGEQMNLTMDQHVEARLKELNVKPPQQGQTLEIPTVVQQAIAKPPDLADPQHDAIPAEERSIRLEWGRKKLAGRSLPDVEDYVRRRLAGELFND
jgi:hypothetical protein